LADTCGEDGRPSRKRDSARTRDDILHAAGRRFARVGYAHVTLKEIADDAGITPAMILRYYGSKRGLFRAVAHYHADSDSFRPTGTKYDPVDLARGLVEYWQDEGARWTAMALIRSPDMDETLPLLRAEVRHRMLDPWLAVLTGDDAKLRGDLVVALTMGFGLFGLGVFLQPDRPPLAPDEAERAVKYLAAMLSVCIEGVEGADTDRE
jgi:AcrR family transcriptional regulator